MLHSILINTPISSPLHPQLNLPLLKAHLAEHGFNARVIDSNILFFKDFLGDGYRVVSAEECDENPLKLLEYYNDLENRLFERSKAFRELHVGLRSLAMRYDRQTFGQVVAGLRDREANPFVAFYEGLVAREIGPSGAGLVGIAITFQDQIIPAFTLAAVLRDNYPAVKIAMGGQMVTRCHDTMTEEKELCSYFDYLALWDGEETILDIHRMVFGGADLSGANVIDLSNDASRIDRPSAAPKSRDIPRPDFSDLDLSDYLFPEFLVPLQTTRGCYAKCAFCAIPFGSNSYRVRRAKDVVEDILAIQDHTLEKYGRKATYFKFMEDTSSPSLLHNLSVEIEDRKIDAKWETFARLEKTFAESGFLEQLYRGGCRKIHWGLETNDPDILSYMRKKTDVSYTDRILSLAGTAGILNFCFLLIGFPGETHEMRKNLTQYVVGNLNIHTLTMATFDLTRKSPMAEEFVPDNEFELDCAPATGFQVRLPYTVNGEDWKPKVVSACHKMMIEIVKHRPDIGFMMLFPDQIRSMFCDKYGADWGRKFVARYGRKNVLEMLVNTEKYVTDYQHKREIDIAALPEPLKREHFRTKEDMAMLAQAVLRRRDYEQRRIEQV